MPSEGTAKEVVANQKIVAQNPREVSVLKRVGSSGKCY